MRHPNYKRLTGEERRLLAESGPVIPSAGNPDADPKIEVENIRKILELSTNDSRRTLRARPQKDIKDAFALTLFIGGALLLLWGFIALVKFFWEHS